MLHSKTIANNDAGFLKSFATLVRRCHTFFLKENIKFWATKTSNKKLRGEKKVNILIRIFTDSIP